MTFDLMTFLTVLIPTLGGAFTAWMVFKGKAEETRNSREARLEDRVGNLERNMQRMQLRLSNEERFSHNLVLRLYSVLDFLSKVVRYRERHQGKLPDGLPELPDIEELKAALEQKPDDSWDAT